MLGETDGPCKRSWIMKIEAYILTWNESDIIGLVIKHYQKFCEKVIIMDNHSSDNTCQIAESMGCEVRKFGTQFFDDAENMNCKNTCWKGSDADWVIVCDADEVLWNPFRFSSYEKVLKHFELKGETIIKTYGWQIMSDSMPKFDLLEITNGHHFSNYSKSIIFSPKHLQEINYNPGAHRCNPVGNVVWSDETLYVLHYKHIGGVGRTINRYREYRKRLSRNNIKNGWGIHYNRTMPSLKEEWNQRMSISKPLI
jgi:glycosyltransferase involved in cell wall biosynthesis